MKKESTQIEGVLYCVVVQDPLTKKPVEYAFYENESQAIQTMSNIIASGRFAAVAKKRIKSKYSS